MNNPAKNRVPVKQPAGPRPGIKQGAVLRRWTIGIWVALLWSCMVELTVLRQLGSGGVAIVLALVLNFVVVVICVAALLRIHWARHALRVVALLWVVWVPVSALRELSLWRQLAAAVDPQDGAAQAMQQAMQQHMQTVLLLDLGMKLVLTGFWLWLGWRLGRVDVAPYFNRRRKPKLNA